MKAAAIILQRLSILVPAMRTPHPSPMKARTLPFLFAAALLIAFGVSNANAADAPGATSVMKWKDGKKAVFLLMFDDSAPSAVKTVVPELKKRGFVVNMQVDLD